MIYSIVIQTSNNRGKSRDRTVVGSKLTNKELLDIALRHLSRAASIDSQRSGAFVPQHCEATSHCDTIAEALSATFNATYFLGLEKAQHHQQVVK